MPEKTIKHLQFWYTVDVPGPGGTTVTTEKIASRGQTVDITSPYDLQRGENEDAFMTDAEAEAFRNTPGAYDPAAELERAMAAGPAPDFDWANASVDDMADYMEEHSLNVNAVLEVGQAHPDRINDILEAEGIVTEDSPRKGVTEGLAKIAEQNTE